MITGSQIEDISKTALIPLWARANADKYTGVNSREWKLSKSGEKVGNDGKLINLPECQKDKRACHRSRATWSSRLG